MAGKKFKILCQARSPPEPEKKATQKRHQTCTLAWGRPDFMNKKSHLEEMITSRGHICDFYPKYHCAVLKLIYRNTSKTTDIKDEKGMCDFAPLSAYIIRLYKVPVPTYLIQLDSINQNKMALIIATRRLVALQIYRLFVPMYPHI